MPESKGAKTAVVADASSVGEPRTLEASATAQKGAKGAERVGRCSRMRSAKARFHRDKLEGGGTKNSKGAKRAKKRSSFRRQLRTVLAIRKDRHGKCLVILASGHANDLPFEGSKGSSRSRCF